MSKRWITWLSLCGGALVTAVLISTAVAVHNPNHYDGRSVAFTVLVVLSVEAFVTVLRQAIRWIDLIDRGRA